jgi:hypothetical protein
VYIVSFGLVAVGFIALWVRTFGWGVLRRMLTRVLVAGVFFYMIQLWFPQSPVVVPLNGYTMSVIAVLGWPGIGMLILLRWLAW